MAEITKEKRISEELDRIKKLFEKVDENEKAIIASLLQNAAFMKVTLEDLQGIINTEGVTEVYQNGANQRGIKQSATLQSYNALIKNYASVIKTISQFVPRAEKKAASEMLLEQFKKEKTEEELEEEQREREADIEYNAYAAGVLLRTGEYPTREEYNKTIKTK